MGQELSTNERYIRNRDFLDDILPSLKILHRIDNAADTLPLPIVTAKERETFFQRYMKELASKRS